MEFKIESCNEPQQKALRTILESLPQYFGVPSAIDEYVEESANYEMISIYNEQTMIGFVTLKPTSLVTLELYVMGILKEYQRLHLGSKLMECIKVYASRHQYHYLQVKTLAPSVQDEHYLKNYAFYKAMGFEEVEVLPLWDEWNPCLLMIQQVA